MNIALRPARLIALLTLVAAAAGCDEDVVTPGADAAVVVPSPDAAPPTPDLAPVVPDDAGNLPDLPPPPDGGATPLYGDQPFSIVLIPDTQFYVQSYPDMFISEAAWIVQQKDAMKFAFALHLGDIVETFTQQLEWSRADDALKMLETAKLPYVVCAGNHDFNTQNRDTSQLNKNFPPTRFAPHLQATFEPNKVENAYYLLPAGGRTWLILVLEFGPRNEVVAWADTVVKQHADKPTILLTHAYMYLGQKRYDQAETTQFWNPHGYNMPGSTNDGQEMFQKLVSGNENILLVFSGHATWPEGAAGLLSTKRSNGYYLHEMLSNFQGCPTDYMCVNRVTKKPVRGGEGMLRVLHVDPASKRAMVATYSPYLMQSRMEMEHQFELPLE